MNINQIKQFLDKIPDQDLARLSPICSTLTLTPHPRQQDFLNLKCEEALFGGSCGGGKTQCLLMWLAEGVQIPGYSAIFFRRTYAQLAKSNDSPLSKSHELFKPLGGKYKASEYRWTFPSGASIEFGHLQHEMSVMDYQGPAYHRVAYDELSQFSEQQYTYLFSRMRMRKDFPIKMGIRAASNPGGPGHAWVKARFITPESEKSIKDLSPYQPSPRGMVFYSTPNRAFVPARVADNPSLDIEDYVERLRTQLPPVLRQRLLNGDWSVVEDAAIKPDWLRYYQMRGEILIPLNVHGQIIGDVERSKVIRFATVDTAGTSKQKAEERRGRPPSWSVCQVWDYWPQGKFLFLRHVWRDRVAWDDLKRSIKHVLDQWKPSKVLIENAHHGPPLAAELKDYQPQLISTSTGQRAESGRPGKLERATQLLNKLSNGEIFLPQYNNHWLPELEAEWLAWTGMEEETSDQVDAAAYAARHANSSISSSWGGVLNYRPIRGGFFSAPGHWN